MRVFASFATMCAIASSVAIETEAEVETQRGPPPGTSNVVPYCEDCIEDFSYNGYSPNSSDYNKQVYSFEEDENVFDQKSYESRVQTEAKLMVALEALKSSIIYIRKEIDDLRGGTLQTRDLVSANFEDLVVANSIMQHDRAYFHARQDKLYDECSYAQHELDDKRDALVLYCQQFAFAPQMAGPCDRLIDGRQRLLFPKFQFKGDRVFAEHPLANKETLVRPQREPLREPIRQPAPKPTYDEAIAPGPSVRTHDGHDFRQPKPQDFPNRDHNLYDFGDEMQSTHGFKLNHVGGNVPVDPTIDPELAAAAITPTEAIIQHQGVSVLAPLKDIDVDKVELACNNDGCVLTPDDGNPQNDIAPENLPLRDGQVMPPMQEISTHGMVLNEVGGYADVPLGTNPELAAAAVSPTEAVIQHMGKTIIAPIEDIDVDKVELACIDDGCALIKDDGNPDNDIILPGM